MKKTIKYLSIVVFLFINSVNAIENKIILKVNNDIITSLDILKEINNLKFFNKKLDQINDEEVFQIALQSIMKYKIKEIEIDRVFNKKKPDNAEYLKVLLENEYKKLNFNSLEDFKNELTLKKIDFKDFEKKLKIEMLWNQIIFTRYSEKVKINKEELRKQIENQDPTITSFELSEIVFEIKDLNEINKTYELIKKDINELGFENAASKHSLSNTAINGGNLGWISELQINNEILNNLNSIKKGSITRPIRMPGSFLILKKNNTKIIQKNFDVEEELKKQINYQTDLQLNNYSNIYFNKVKKDMKINAP